ncbi:MAG: hypothetical protein MUF39_09000 [Cyclobacteriaceae bacterium]|jgi:hypothetical protein|nr:hypothetical protein [Cyclobacteriaceae bacterium]
MKSILLVTLIFCLSYTTKADVLVDGYMVLTGQDTAACKIKLAGKKKVTGYYMLVIVTEDGQEKIYNAEDKLVQAYGFEYLGMKYDYRFVEIFKTYKSGFFRLIDDGKNYKLYVNMISDYSYPVATTEAHYAVFKPNGEYVDLTTFKLGNWRKNLRIILSDNPDALKAMESISSKEIPDFIKSLNKTE